LEKYLKMSNKKSYGNPYLDTIFGVKPVEMGGGGDISTIDGLEKAIKQEIKSLKKEEYYASEESEKNQESIFKAFDHFGYDWEDDVWWDTTHGVKPTQEEILEHQLEEVVPRLRKEHNEMGEGGDVSPFKVDAINRGGWDEDSIEEVYYRLGQIQRSADYDNTGRGYGIKVTIEKEGFKETYSIKKWLELKDSMFAMFKEKMADGGPVGRHFEEKAREVLKGHRIVGSKRMPEDEGMLFGWHTLPMILFLENGTYLIAQADAEGNDGGEFKIEPRAKKVIGSTISGIRYATAYEADRFGWDNASIVLVLDDGTHIFIARDPEGNDAGALLIGLPIGDEIIVPPTPPHRLKKKMAEGGEIDKYVEIGKDQIRQDVKDGVVPSTVKSFSELHDYVDANEYAGFTEDGYVPSKDYDLENRVQGELDDWIRGGGLKKMAEGGDVKRWFEVYDEKTGRTLSFEARTQEEAEEQAKKVNFADYYNGEMVFAYEEGQYDQSHPPLKGWKVGDVFTPDYGNYEVKIIELWDGLESGREDLPVVWGMVQRIKKDGSLVKSEKPREIILEYKYGPRKGISEYGSSSAYAGGGTIGGYKAVQFKDKIEGIEEPFYYVVREKGDNYEVVIDEKIDLFERYKNKPEREYYAEWIPKEEFEGVHMADGGGVRKSPISKLAFKMFKKEYPTLTPKQQKEVRNEIARLIESGKMAQGGTIDLFGGDAPIPTLLADGGSVEIAWDSYSHDQKLRLLQGAGWETRKGDPDATAKKYAKSNWAGLSGAVKNVLKRNNPMAMADGGKIPTNNASVKSWDEIPDQWKIVKPVKKVSYNLSLNDKGLGDIMASFVGRDELRPIMMGIDYSENGIAATDAHRILAFDKKVAKKDYGTYAYTDIGGDSPVKKDDKIDDRYPNWPAVIPMDNSHVYKVDFLKLKTYCEAMNKGAYSNRTTFMIAFRLKGEDSIGFNSNMLIEICNTMLKMGVRNGYIGASTPNRGAIFSSDKETAKNGTKGWNGKSGKFIALLMPVMLNVDYSSTTDVEFPDFGTADPDMGRISTVYYDFSKDAIMNADGKEAKFDENLKEAKTGGFTKEQLKMFKAVILTSNTIPILDYVAVEDGRAKASRLDVNVSVAVKGFSDGMYEIINNYPSRVVDAPEGHYTPTLDDFVRFPKIEKAIGAITVNRNELEDALYNASRFAGKDELRPVMMGMHLFTDGDKVVYEATDAHKIVRRELKSAKTGTRENIDVIIEHPKILHTIISNSECGDVDIRMDEKNTEFTCGDTHVIVRNTEARYPNVKAILPPHSEKKAGLSSAAINRCLKGLSAKEKKNGAVVIGDKKLTYFSFIEGAGKDEPRYKFGKVLCELPYTESKGEYAIDENNVILLMPLKTDNEDAINEKVADIYGTFNAALLQDTMSGVQGAFDFYSNGANKAFAITPEPIKSTAPVPKREVEEVSPVVKKLEAEKVKLVGEALKHMPSSPKQKTVRKKIEKVFEKIEKHKKEEAKEAPAPGQTRLGLKMDKARKAMKPGKRVSASGNTYWESRANRSDADQRVRLGGGGDVGLPPTDYGNKSAEEVWDSWSASQRKHFLTDHAPPRTLTAEQIEKVSQWDYSNVGIMPKAWLDKHISMGRYADGGTIKKSWGNPYLNIIFGNHESRTI